MNKVDLVDDPELLNWLKWKSVNCYFYGFDGDNTPIIQGSATGALAGEENGLKH
jgi:elongation factor Tu